MFIKSQDLKTSHSDIISEILLYGMPGMMECILKGGGGAGGAHKQAPKVLPYRGSGDSGQLELLSLYVIFA